MNEKLDIEQHDDGTVTIEGTRYSNSFFRELGCSFSHLGRQTLRVAQKENGVVWLSRIDDVSCIYRLNTDKPGLYIAHLDVYVSDEMRQKIKNDIEKKLNKFAEGSSVLVFGPEIRRCVAFNEESADVG